MARQVLTLPDVPATLLTQAAAAATYLPLTGGTLTGDLTRNGADLSNRLIKWQTNGADRWRMGIIDAQAEGAPDTGGDFTFQYVWNDGTAFDLYRIDRNVGALVFNAQNAAVVFEANGTTYPLIVRSQGDTQPAFQVQYNGRLEWGTGGAATDTYLNRGGVGALQVGATLFPGNASTNDLGTTASRWRKLWAAAGEFTTVPTVGGVALPTSAGVAALYLPLAGGTLTGVLRVNANVGVGVAPAAWVSRVGMQIGNAGALGGDPTGTTFTLASNSYYDGVNKAIVTGAGVLASLSSGSLSIFTAPSVAAGAAQTFTNRLSLAATGTLTLTPDVGQSALAMQAGGAGTIWYLSPAAAGLQLIQSGVGTRLQVAPTGTLTLTPDAGQPTLSSPSTISVESTASINLKAGTGAAVSLFDSGGVSRVNLYQNQWYPSLDNSTPNGLPANRWTYVAAVAGAINTSLAEAKTDITPLDPVACAQAVLDTDWVSFSYRPPSYTEPPDTEDQAPEDRQRRVDEGRAAHAKMLVETQPIRDQKGYVLGSPDHQTHDLFGLSDRKSASPSTDLAVVACALQHCLLEIAELKARLA